MTDFIPWERQPGETSVAWLAFTVYRDLGPARSLSKAAQSLNKGRQVLADWCGKHAWVARCAAWDAEADRQHRIDLREAQRAMLREHADVARKLREKAMVGFAEVDAAALGAYMVVKWIEAATKLEQTTLGLPTERVAETVTAPEVDPLNAYFASLPDDTLVKMTQDALNTLQSGKDNPNGKSDDSADSDPQGG